MENQEEEKKKRNATVYGKIAKLFAKPEAYVKAILKVGQVNPLYFERLASGRISAFQAYNNCLDEEKKQRSEVPLSELPKVSEPIYVTDEIELPDYDAETVTNDTSVEAENKVALEEVFNNLNVTVTAVPEQSDDITVPPTLEQIGTKIVICQCPACGQTIEVKINNK